MDEEIRIGTFLYVMGIAGGILLGATLAQAQSVQPVNPNKPQWITNQGGQNNNCVGLLTPNVETTVVNDNRGAYSIYDWAATSAGHIDMQDNDPPSFSTVTETKNAKGKVTGTVTKSGTSPMTNLEVRVYVGDQTTECDKTSTSISGCTLAADEHYTMLPGTTSPYPFTQVQILPNGLEYEAIKVTAEVDRPASCVGAHYVTTEHSNP
jgi:hypothetical protein